MKSPDKRSLSSNFERVITCLKKNQADVDNVKGKNQQLLHMVEEMLQPKQVGLILKIIIKCHTTYRNLVEHLYSSVRLWSLLHQHFDHSVPEKYLFSF